MPGFDEDDVRLELPDAGVTVRGWSSYAFNSHFLTPTDGFSFSVGIDDLTTSQRSELVAGSSVALYVNGHPHCSGYIDGLRYSSTRGGGTEISVTGRDKLSPVVDGYVDPKLKFARDQTLLDVLKQLFAPYGWDNDDDFLISADANQFVLTGKRGIPTGRGKKHKPLKSFVLHQLQPYPHEGAFAFAARITQRHGLWIWLSSTGNKLIVGKPESVQEPIYHLRRSVTGSDTQRNTITAGVLEKSLEDQPSLIFADGFSGGSAFGKSKIKAFAVNPLVGLDAEGFVLPEVVSLISKHPDAKQITVTRPSTALLKTPAKKPWAIFLHDDESKTIDQLENFIRRELSLRMRKAVTYNASVKGHTQNGVPWAVDTLCTVTDEAAGIDEPMYVLSRTFKKSRSEGTTTDLEMILPGSLVF